jgi:hypothetical protein
MGIEPTSEAWEASILPLYDARSSSKGSDSTILRKCLKLLLVITSSGANSFKLDNFEKGTQATPNPDFTNGLQARSFERGQVGNGTWLR